MRVSVLVQEEHRQDMEVVLAERTLAGLSAARALSDSLMVTVETQQQLANEVDSHPCQVSVLLCWTPPHFHCARPSSGGGHEGGGRSLQ